MIQRDHKGFLSWQWQYICLLALLGTIVSLTNPSPARGDARQFIPKIFDYSGELGFEFHGESIENTSNGVGLKTSDTLLTEKMTLTADGYSYDPRFVLFHLKLSADVEQEWFKSNELGSSSQIKVLPEYEFRMLLLAEHPYNLEVYAQRFAPFIRAQMSLAPNPVVYSNGAIFSYRKKPIFLSLQYDDTSYSSNIDTRDTKTYSAQATYVIKRFSNSVRYSHRGSTSSEGDQTVNGDFISDDHQLILGQARLTGNASYAISDQRSPLFPTLDTSRLNLTENLAYTLPWNFDSSLYYGYSRDTTKSAETAESPESQDFNSSNSAGFNLTHRLFRSVVTSLNYNITSSKSSGGDQISTVYSLTSTYTKRMFFGTMAISGYVNQSTLDRKGSVVVLNEVYNAQLFGEFTLNQQNVDSASIVVRVVSPATGALVDLQRGTNYTVLLIGNNTTVRIMSLPVDVLNPDPMFIYEFRVSYSPLSGAFKIQTPSYGYSLRLGLFKNLINPYFSYDKTSQRLISGTFPGPLEDAEKITVGVVVAKGPYALLAEYENSSSRLNPSKRYLSELRYSDNIFKTVNLSAHIRYEHRIEVITDITTPALLSGTTGGERPTDIYGGDIGIDKRFTNTNLTFSFFSSYLISKDPEVNTKSLALNSYLTFAAGYFDLQAGAEISRVNSDSAIGNQKELRDYYYLLIKRKLF